MLKHLVVFSIVALASVTALYALELVTAHIPFAFVAGGTTLPAGQYCIKPAGLYAQIYNLEGNGSAFSLTLGTQRDVVPEVITQWVPGPASGSVDLNNPNAPAPTTDASIVFNKYGDQYFISQVWVGLQGCQFPMSPSERALRAAGTLTPETLVLAAAR